MQVALSPDGRFLEVRFADTRRTLSWALVGAGFGYHRRVVSHFVRRAELGLDVDPRRLLETQLARQGYGSAVGLLTARDIRRYACAEAASGEACARAVVTAGLGNALRAGDPAQPGVQVGTINVVCEVSVALTDAALIEAIALVSEARTAALLALEVPSVVSGCPATGTGTDCSVLACGLGPDPQPYAGKHTEVGEAIGKSVFDATSSAAQQWLREQRTGG